MKKFFLFLILFLPVVSFAEIYCAPSESTVFVGENVEWSILGIGDEIPYFISWSSDGIANTPEDSFIYIDKYEIIGEKRARVLFGLEGVEPTYDIVCNPVIILKEIITSTTTTNTASTTNSKRRHSNVYYNQINNIENIILATSTISENIKILEEKDFIKEDNKKVFNNNLWIGLENSEVGDLQRKLLELGFFNEEITNFFGPITERAVIDFQKYLKIEPASGFVGPITRGVLNSL